MRIVVLVLSAFVLGFGMFVFGAVIASPAVARQAQMKVRKSGEFDAKKFAQSKPAIGDVAPDLVLQTLSGETVSLSSYRGKNIVVIKAGYT
ncbi:MAG: hypothetical protein AB8B55_23780 [Mariniblastus sp.]